MYRCKDYRIAGFCLTLTLVVFELQIYAEHKLPLYCLTLTLVVFEFDGAKGFITKNNSLTLTLVVFESNRICCKAYAISKFNLNIGCI